MRSKADTPDAELVEFVRDRVGLPLDVWAVAATLESRGLRDVDAIEQYGQKSIFHLAESIYPEVWRQGNEAMQGERRHVPENMCWWRRLSRFVKLYAKGTVFAMPMAGQITAVLILRYSLWAWLDFDNLTATLVAIGTIGSFLITGGLVQAIGREGTFYTGSENFVLLDRCMRGFVLGGTVATLLVALAAALLNAVFPFFGWDQLGVILLYFVLLAPLWLVLAILYMLQDNVMILVSTLSGTGVVHLVMTFTSWGIVPSHACGLVTANLVAALWAWWKIQRKLKGVDQKYHRSKLPRPSVLLHIIEPFLIYGVCYFTFLFVDRLIAWSASDFPLPLVIWFRTPYELGMDWALLSLVFTIAVLEYTIHEFSESIIPMQKSYAAAKFVQFDRRYQRFYRRQVSMLVVVATGSVVATFLAVNALRRYDYIMEIHDFFRSPVTTYTFWWAALGYSILAFGLLNSLFFFSLSQPWVVVRAIAPALLVNVAVGFVASRMIDYQYAVLGLVAGSTYFAYRSYLSARELFDKLDFYYYAAF